MTTVQPPLSTANGITNWNHANNQPYPNEISIAAGENYPNKLEPFFGPPTKKIDHDPSHAFPHEAWFLPGLAPPLVSLNPPHADAYQGRNDYIRETIVQVVVNFNSFITQKILPWREQQNPNIAWDSIKFDRTLADFEPEQVIPRIETYTQ